MQVDHTEERLPFTVHGTGRVAGRSLMIDASASSQFVSGLLIAAPRFDQGVRVLHDVAAGPLPSVPHIVMTIRALEGRGVRVETVDDAEWIVDPQPILGREVDIEPDLSNAAPFLAAALVAGGRVTVPGWPAVTTQVGDRLRGWLAAFGAAVSLDGGALTVDGGRGALGGGALRAVDLDLSSGGELAPTLVGLAAFADGPSRFRGIGHLRGHETDRLAALAAELTAVGAVTTETADGLVVEPGPLAASARPWRSYADHRMSTTGALLGPDTQVHLKLLEIHGLNLDDVETTAKTLPGFVGLWTRMLQ